jgi:hypothetical protein
VTGDGQPIAEGSTPAPPRLPDPTFKAAVGWCLALLSYSALLSVPCFFALRGVLSGGPRLVP